MLFSKHLHHLFLNIVVVVVVGDLSRGWLEGSFFNSYNTKASGRALLLSLDCSTLPSIHTLYCWMLSKEVSSTIFKVFGMMRPGTGPRSPRPLVNTLPTRPMGQFLNIKQSQFLSYEFKRSEPQKSSRHLLPQTSTKM